MLTQYLFDAILGYYTNVLCRSVLTFLSIEVQKIQVGGRILAVLLNNRSIKIFGPLLAIGLMMDET